MPETIILPTNITEDPDAYRSVHADRASGKIRVSFDALPETEQDKFNFTNGYKTRGSFLREGKQSDHLLIGDLKKLISENVRTLHALGNSVRSGSQEAKDIHSLLAMCEENRWPVGENLERWMAKAKNYITESQKFRNSFKDASYVDSFGIPLEPFKSGRTISALDARKIQTTPLMQNFVEAVESEARKINPNLKISLHECAGPVRRALGYPDVEVTNGEKTPQGGSARKYASWFASGKYADNFLEVSDVPQSREELKEFLKDLPAGAITIYLDGSRPAWHGHIQVSMGRGTNQFISDFLHGPLVYSNVKNVRVFIPSGTTKD